jgi:hypothetical protein
MSTFRAPRSFGPAASSRQDWSAALQAEIAAERNVTIDKAAQRLESTLAAVKAEPAPRDPALVQAAAQAVFAYLVVRDACGRSQEDTVRKFGIPGYVLARVGAA